MKGFERILLVVFSLIIIVISISMILVSAEMIQLSFAFNATVTWLVSNKVTGLVIGAIFALLGLVGLFSSSDASNSIKGGLALKSDTGTVYISKETFENIILGVTRNYAELRNVKTEIEMTEDGVIANIYALILPDTVVPALTTKLKENVRDSVLKQTTVEIKEANVKIKGVYLEPQKK
ncbi:MAG: alkaline shock response membrane anchor protein AmaP [Clostridia bacterium]